MQHWDGVTWTVIAGLPDVGNARLNRVYAAGADDVWAIIEQPEGTTAFLHWDGANWATVPVPGPKLLGWRYYYTSISGTGPDDVWAAGSVTSHSTTVSTLQVARLTCA